MLRDQVVQARDDYLAADAYEKESGMGHLANLANREDANVIMAELAMEVLILEAIRLRYVIYIVVNYVYTY